MGMARLDRESGLSPSASERSFGCPLNSPLCSLDDCFCADRVSRDAGDSSRRKQLSSLLFEAPAIAVARHGRFREPRVFSSAEAVVTSVRPLPVSKADPGTVMSTCSDSDGIRADVKHPRDVVSALVSSPSSTVTRRVFARSMTTTATRDTMLTTQLRKKVPTAKSTMSCST